MVDFLKWEDITIFITIAVAINVSFWALIVLFWRASRLRHKKEIYEFHYVQWLIVVLGTSILTMCLAQYIFRTFIGSPFV